MSIAESAVVASDVSIGAGTEIGEFTVMEHGVVIGNECRIGPHVVIRAGSILGDGVQVDSHSVIGKERMRAKRSILKQIDELPPARVGDGCLIGTHATIYRGAELGEHCLVADQATVREQVSIGEYTIVGRNVVVENQVTVGRKCKLETNCYITAYSTIEDFCFIAPMVSTSNDRFIGRTEERFKHFKGVTVRRGGRIGVAATILPGITIGQDAVVGAGSVVTHDVPDKKMVVGVPARLFGDVPPEQLLDAQGWE